MSYKEAVEWVEEHFDQKVKYTTLYSYMRHNFGTKLKHPRKHHYNQDKQAIEAFKKTSEPA
jgi:transposase